MTACLVTDRTRFGGAHLPFDAARDRLVERLGGAIAAGVDLIQIRERDLEARKLAALVEDVVERTKGTSTRVVVNDRLDVALASGADGVHLRADSISAADVRRIAPSAFLVGRSVHTLQEAVRAGPVDYMIAGPMFLTPSKPDEDRLLGLDGLRAIVGAVAVPVLAIGGLTLDRLPEVAAAGAAGVAAIGLFAETSDLVRLLERIHDPFDSRKSSS